MKVDVFDFIYTHAQFQPLTRFKFIHNTTHNTTQHNTTQHNTIQHNIDVF